MPKELIILDEDKAWARQRITELDEAIQVLGPEFYDVFNQSSETWHDNAPFDALRDRQAVLDAERQHLRSILRESLPAVPKQPHNRVGVGSTVVLEDGRTYFIAGDWTPFSGQVKDGAMVISYQAPLTKHLLAKREGDQVAVGRKQTHIRSIN